MSPVSYDPVSGMVYVAGVHRPTVMALEKIPNAPGAPALFQMTPREPSASPQSTGALTAADNSDTHYWTPPATRSWGTLTAIDVKNGGHAVWQMKTPAPLVGGTLATAGGLVFTGESNGHFDAFDATTGQALWTYQTGANVAADVLYSQRTAICRRRDRGRRRGRHDPARRRDHGLRPARAVNGWCVN